MHTPSLLLAGAHFNDLTSLALSLAAVSAPLVVVDYVCLCMSWQNTRALLTSIYIIVIIIITTSTTGESGCFVVGAGC